MSLETDAIKIKKVHQSTSSRILEMIYLHSVPLKGVLHIGLVAGTPNPPKVSVYDGLGKTLDVLKIAPLTITIVGWGLMEGRAYLSSCDRKVGVCRTKKKE